MQLNVKDIAYSDLGTKNSFKIKLEEVDFNKDDNILEVSGVVSLSRVDEGILAEFQVDLRVNLMCDRCLGDFTFKPKLKFSRIYSLKPLMKDSEELPLPKNFEIDIISPIREEAIIAIPFQKICQANCAGLCAHCGADLNKGDCNCSKVEKKKV